MRGSVRGRVGEQRGGERPAPLDLRGAGAPPAGEAAPGVALALGHAEPRRPERGEGVVGHLTCPGQVPQGLLQLQRLAGLQVGEQVGPEGRPALEALADRMMQRPVRTVGLDRGRPQPAGVLAEVESHTARAASQRPGPHPHELAAGTQLVEPGGGVGAGAPRQHVPLPNLRGERQTLQRHQQLAQAVDACAAGRRRVHPLPGGQEARERTLLGRLNLLAQAGQRGAPQAPEHVGIAPLPLASAGAQLAQHEPSVPLELAEDGTQVHGVAVGGLPRGEGPVGAGVAASKALKRLLDLLEEGGGQPAGGHGAEGVAVQGGVLGRDPALLPADAHPHRAPLTFQVGQHPLVPRRPPGSAPAPRRR